MKRQHGFTLVELMMVIVILGILVSLAVPAASNILEKQRLTAAARKITVNIREAQQLAIAQERNVFVQFRLNNSGAAANSYSIKFSELEPYRTEYLADGIIIAYTNLPSNKLIFGILGTVVNSGTIRLENNQGDMMFIIADSIGRVRTSNVPPN